ncbi:MAG: enoyl-CoA hydratase, partial [Planctomycetota bacterium]
PVRPGDRVTATATVRKARPRRGIYVFETVCTRQDGTRVLEGEAVVRYRPEDES